MTYRREVRHDHAALRGAWSTLLLCLALLLGLAPAGRAATLKFEESRHPLAAGNGQLTSTTTPIGVVPSYRNGGTSLFALDSLNSVVDLLSPPTFAVSTAFATGTAPQQLAVGRFANVSSVMAIPNRSANTITLRDTSSNNQTATLSGATYGFHDPVRVAIGFGTIYVLNGPDADGWSVTGIKNNTNGQITGPFVSQTTALDPAKYTRSPQDAPYAFAIGQDRSQASDLVIGDGPDLEIFTSNGLQGGIRTSATISIPNAAADTETVGLAVATSTLEQGDIYQLTRSPNSNDDPGTLTVWEMSSTGLRPYAHAVPGASALALSISPNLSNTDIITASSDSSGATPVESVRLFPWNGAGHLAGTADDYPDAPTLVPLAANPYTQSGTASAPVAVAGGDFDGDGTQELATANRRAGDVSVFHRIGAPTQATLTVSPTRLTANGTSTATLTATFKDAAGRGVYGDPITITASSADGAASTPTVGTVTDAGGGVYTATVTTAQQLGQATLTATDPAVNPALSATATLDQVAGAPATAALTLSPTSIPADGTSTTLASAVVKDAQGNGVAGETVTFDTTGTQGIGTPVDNGNGTYTATITGSKQPGTATITVQVRSLSADATLTQTSLPPDPGPPAPPAPDPADPPTAEISQPGGTLVLAPGSTGPITRFSCTEGARGPGLASCLDSNGDAAPTGRLDTSQPGRRTYRVIATSASGQTGSARLQYVVAAPPTATIASPADGASVLFGARVATSIDCTDGVGGPGIVACEETGNAPGAPGYLDTSTPGGHTYTVTATSSDGLTAQTSRTYTVAYAPLSVVADSDDDVAVAEDAVRFTARVRGGLPPYHYDWSGTDTDPSGRLPSSQASTLSFAFAKTGRRSVRVRVTDSAVPPQIVQDDRTITVEERCVRKLDLGVATVTAACLTPSPASTDARPVYRSSTGIKLNGQRISGSLIDVRPGDVTTPSLITSPDATLAVRGTTVQQGPLSWSVPFKVVAPTLTSSAAEVAITGLSIPPSATRLLGLDLDAGGQWYAGEDADGSPYVRFVANLVIPGFTTTGGESGKKDLAATAQVSVRIDASGSSIKNAYAQVENARLGKELAVENLCLSFVSAGTPASEEQTPDMARRCGVFTTPTGDKILTCGTDVQADRWDGTAEVKLPFEAIKGIHASGGVSNGKFSYFAAAIDLGHAVPLVDPIAYLTQIRGGICLQPAPLTVTGGASVGVLPDPKDPEDELIKVNGDFTYTDGYTNAQNTKVPWNATLKGNVKAYGADVGDGSLSFGGNNIAAMHLHTGQSYAGGLISVSGDVDGQMSFTSGRFNVEGDLHACMASVICAGAEALVSSDGLSACVTIIPAVDLYFFSTPEVRAGFGFRWATQHVSVMAPSCDVGDWRATITRAQLRGLRDGDPSAPIPLYVGPGETLKNIRLVGGDGGPPNVIVRGPNGELLQLAPGAEGTGAFGQNLMVKDRSGGATVIQLVRPAAGTWTIEPADATSPVRSIETAPVLERPVVTGKLTPLAGGRERLSYTYTPQTGVDFTFDEVGVDHKAAQRLTVVKTNCGQKVCTGTLDFTPALGLRGKREVVATTMREGNLVAQQSLASYVAEGTSAGRPGSVRVARLAHGIRACWTAADGAVRYDVAARERIIAHGRLAYGYGVAKVTDKLCATFPALHPGAAVQLTIAAKDAIGGHGPSLTRLVRVKALPKAARVRGLHVTRLTGGRLLVRWAAAGPNTAKFAVVAERAGVRRQLLVSPRCGGTVLATLPRGRTVNVRVAGLGRDGVAGPLTIRRLTLSHLPTGRMGPLATRAVSAGCRLR